MHTSTNTYTDIQIHGGDAEGGSIVHKIEEISKSTTFGTRQFGTRQILFPNVGTRRTRKDAFYGPPWSVWVHGACFHWVRKERSQNQTILYLQKSAKIEARTRPPRFGNTRNN